MTDSHIKLLTEIIAKGRILQWEIPREEETAARELIAAGLFSCSRISRRPPFPVVVIMDAQSRIEGRAALDAWKKKRESESPSGKAKALGKKALLLIGALIGIAATKLTEILIDHWLK